MKVEMIAMMGLTNDATVWYKKGPGTTQTSYYIKGHFLFEDPNIRIHRTKGPAVLYKDGSEAYFVEGKKHRINGPAIDYTNSHKEWWFKGINYSFPQYLRVLKKNGVPNKRLALLALKYG
jgi:hypothetical protein